MAYEHGATHCKRHPEVETGLHCSRCDDPICPRCLVQTPVGARCEPCASLRRSPLVVTSASELTKAAGAGVGSALLLGALYAFVLPALGLASFLITVVALGALGYLIGEVVHRASGYKRNTQLQYVAAASVVVAVAVMLVVWGVGPVGLLRLSPSGVIGLLAGVYFAVQRVRV